MFGAARRDKAFKDYCLVLQVHPEADAAMIDAAYWHLAKRYNQASAYDSQAKAKLEELNEAYIVLGSAEKREEYMKVRSRILGADALPEAPRLPDAAPPLAIMSRNRPQAASEFMAEPPAVHRKSGKLVAVGLVLVVALVVGMAFWLPAPLAFVPAVLGVLLAVGYLVVRRKLRPSSGSGRDRRQATALTRAPASLRNVREHAAGAAAAAELSPSAGAASSTVDQSQLDRFRDHAERLRTVARSVVEGATPAPSEAKSQPVDRAAIEQIRRETEATTKPGPAIDQDQADRLREHTDRLRTVASLAGENAATPEGVAQPENQPVDRATIEQIKRETDALRRQGRPDGR